MNNRVKPVLVALMAVLTSVTLTGHAFTFGELRGGAVIGRPLDVSVPVQASAGEAISASCITAEVYHAEARQITPGVSVLAAPSDLAPMVLVRIQSRAVVNEPVVTVLLRAGCGASLERRFVLLADFQAPDLPANLDVPVLVVPAVDATAQPNLPPLPETARSAPVAKASPVAVKSRGAKPGGSKKTAVPRKRLAQAKKPPSPAAAAFPLARPPASDKAILKLDPSEVLSSQINSAASAASSAAAGEALLQAKMVGSLQAEIKALNARALKNDQTLTDMRTLLQQTQSERVPALWFYLLFGLLLCCVTALAWILWRQQRPRGPEEVWWQRPKMDLPETVFTASQPPSVSGPALAPMTKPLGVESVVRAAPDAQAQPEVDLDIDLENLAAIENPPVAPSRNRDVPEIGVRSEHAFSVDSVLDVRQEAEFFVSLGQTERAVQLLKKQITDSAQPNPLVYLDLLALCYSHGLVADFLAYRQAFAVHFNGVIPDFSEFQQEGHDLLAYPDALTGLVQRWPGAEAMAFLNDCIFRSDKSPVATPFDLAAFRDLLMLHGVAEKMANGTGNSALHLAQTKVQSNTAFFAKPAPVTETGNQAPLIPRETKPEITLLPLVDAPSGEPTEMQDTLLPMLNLDFSDFLDNSGNALDTESAAKAGVNPQSAGDKLLPQADPYSGPVANKPGQP